MRGTTDAWHCAPDPDRSLPRYGFSPSCGLGVHTVQYRRYHHTLLHCRSFVMRSSVGIIPSRTSHADKAGFSLTSQAITMHDYDAWSCSRGRHCSSSDFVSALSNACVLASLLFHFLSPPCAPVSLRTLLPTEPSFFYSICHARMMRLGYTLV